MTKVWYSFDQKSRYAYEEIISISFFFSFFKINFCNFDWFVPPVPSPSPLTLKIVQDSNLEKTYENDENFVENQIKLDKKWFPVFFFKFVLANLYLIDWHSFPQIWKFKFKKKLQKFG